VAEAHELLSVRGAEHDAALRLLRGLPALLDAYAFARSCA